jgi:hypothetical protein
MPVGADLDRGRGTPAVCLAAAAENDELDGGDLHEGYGKAAKGRSGSGQTGTLMPT